VSLKKICILYPNNPESRFDFKYYTDVHMPRSIELLGAHHGFRGASVEKGLAMADPRSPVAYVAMCHFLFESLEAFMEAFAPNAAELKNDMKNYTDIVPVIQINEVILAK
jgi:uncharacterized protein (TIGR02118 family)